MTIIIIENGANVTQQEHLWNWLMSKVRIGVEWGFGKVKSLFPFLTRRLKLKYNQMDIGRHFRVCVLLKNFHTRLRQSQTGEYFNCRAPTLREYLHR